MFQLNDDMSIYATRGDLVAFEVRAEEDGKSYKFQAGDIVRIKVFAKKDAEKVVLQKDFPVYSVTESVNIYLSKEDTKIGNVISKPVDYWYEIELNPNDENPQTIVGYDEDGAKVFKLFPEGDDVEDYTPTPQDFPVVDTEFDLTSPRPLANQVVAREFQNLLNRYEATHDAVTKLYVTPEMLGAKADGTVEMGDVLQEYIDAAKSNEVYVYFPHGTYKWNETVKTNKTLYLRGERGQVRIINSGNNACLELGGSCTIEGLIFDVSSANRTEFTVKAVGGGEFFCYDTVFTCTSGALNGVHIENVTISHIDRCKFNHSQISLKTWDCKITNTWVWALWRPYGIGIHGGCGNINLSNVDVVPPFRTSGGDLKATTELTGIKAGIWVNSEGGNPTNNIIMENIFLDGNPALNTGIGILCENVFCVTISSFRASCMSGTPIVIDDCYDVVISKGMFYKNNKSSLGTNEILVRRTFGGKCGEVTIEDNHFVNYETNITKSAPAIKVEEGADANLVIARNRVMQDSGKYAYGNISIITPTMRDLHTNEAVGFHYRESGSFTLAKGSTGASLTLSAYMAKNPTQENFRFWVNNGFMPSLRVQENTGNNVWIGVKEAPTSDLTIYYEVTI